MNIQIGSIISADLTVNNAENIKEFYKEVIGWEPEPFQIKDENGSYEDYVMKDSSGTWVGGVCHARGVNLGIPPQWMVYVNVSDIEKSLEKCLALGGKVIKKSMSKEGTIHYAMIQDPSGAILAITKVDNSG